MILNAVWLLVTQVGWIWVSVGRLTGEPASQLVGIAAAVLSAAVLIMWAAGRLRFNGHTRTESDVKREPARA